MTAAAPEPDQGARRTRAWWWWGGSVAVHVAAVVALAVSPTLRHAIFGDPDAPPPPLHTSEATIAKAKATLERLTRERIIRQNEAIHEVSLKLRTMRQAGWDELVRRAEYMAPLAAERDAGFPAPAAVPAPGDIARDDVPTLYAMARRLEEEVFQVYEQHRAIGLTLASAGRGDRDKTVASAQPLKTSLELATLERPPRPDLDRAALGRPVTSLDGDAWRDFKMQMEMASDNAEIMANNARRILDVIEGRDRQIGGKTLVADEGSVRLERWTEDNAYVGATLDLADRLPSDLESVDPKAVITLGRHLGSTDGAQRSAEWLAFDTWHTVGPFAYEGGARTRDSLRHAYPPELGVDLDATYIGKGGKPLRWTWRAFDQVRMEPSKDAYAVNAIWYWYTEFASDEAKKMWINIASDDYSTLWWNGVQVYSSGMEPRPWVPLDARQFVEVDVRKGVNAVLLKLDNGKGTTGFSVVAHLGSRE